MFWLVPRQDRVLRPLCLNMKLSVKNFVPRGTKKVNSYSAVPSQPPYANITRQFFMD